MKLFRKKWLIGVLAAVVVLGAGLWVFQRSMLFLASPFAFVPKLWGLGEMEVVSYRSYDGTELSAWYRPPQRDDAPTIMYFPGARGHLGWEGYRMEPYLEDGYGVFMMGYRGYGSNPGRPSEYAFYRDAAHAARFLRKEGARGRPHGGEPGALHRRGAADFRVWRHPAEYRLTAIVDRFPMSGVAPVYPVPAVRVRRTARVLTHLPIPLPSATARS